jgi:hypothetical protein
VCEGQIGQNTTRMRVNLIGMVRSIHLNWRPRC